MTHNKRTPDGLSKRDDPESGIESLLRTFVSVSRSLRGSSELPRLGEYIWDGDAPELPGQFLEQLRRLGREQTEPQMWEIADNAVAVLADLSQHERTIVIRLLADFERWLRVAETERHSGGSD